MPKLQRTCDCRAALHAPLNPAPHPRAPRRAFTTLELVVSVTVILVLASLATAMVARAQRTRNSTVCAANLRSVGMAFEAYAIDNHTRLPFARGAQNQWEDLLRKYLPRPTFQCPSDGELYPSLGSSYDWRDTGDPLTTLAGKCLTEPVRTNIALAYEALPGWHEPFRVQVVYLDGTVRLRSQEALLQDLTSPIRTRP